MNITIQFEAQLRQLAGVAEIEVAAEDGCDLLEVLRTADMSAALKERIFAPSGDLQPTILVFVDDQSLPSSDAGSTALTDGCKVLLLPPISGG